MRSETELYDLVQRRAGQLMVERRRRQRVGLIGVIALVAGSGVAWQALGTEPEPGAPAESTVASSTAPPPTVSTTSEPGSGWVRTQTVAVDVLKPGRYVLTTEPLPQELLGTLRPRMQGNDILLGVGMPAETDTFIEATPAATPARIVRGTDGTFRIAVDIDVQTVHRPYRGFTVWLD